jgi:hypothetical protein
MLPHQCGIATPGACETVAMGLQNWVEAHQADPNWAILQVDERNAFNAIYREPIFEELDQNAPELVPWVSTCYAEHSHLFAQGHRLSSRCGVQQGDPLGPLLFAVAWHRVVRKLPADLALNVWYLDDGHLVGPLDTLSKAFDIIVTEGALLGVTVNIDKCKLWGPGVSTQQILQEHGQSLISQVPRVPWAAGSGLRVLGLPIEYPQSISFKREQLRAVMHHLQDACALLGHLGDPQMQHLLLRYCLDACRVMHMLRGMDCTMLHAELGVRLGE